MVLVRLVNEDMDALAGEYKGKVHANIRKTEETNQRLRRLYDALETGSLTMEDLAPRIRDLRERQKQLEVSRLEIKLLLSQRRDKLAGLELVTNCVENLRNVLTHSSLAEQRAFIHSFIKEVRVTGGEALLIYTMPLPPSEVMQKQVGLLN